MILFVAICNIATYADDTALYAACDQASDPWQELELSSELESDLQDTCLGQEVASWFCLTVLTRLVLLM